jgi:hypothetical protein
MERQVCAEEGYTDLQENNWSQANECSHAEEVVGVDEGVVGSEEKVESITRRTWSSTFVIARKSMSYEFHGI